VTNRKTILLMTAASRWCTQECCQDNMTHVEEQTRCFVREERYLQSIYH